MPLPPYGDEYYGLRFLFEEPNQRLYVVTKERDSLVVMARLAFSGSYESIFYVEDGHEKRFLPQETTRVFKLVNGGRRIEGIPRDTCWLFKVITGKVNAYSHMPTESDHEIVAFQVDGGDIVPVSKERLTAVVGSSPGLAKLMDRGKFADVISHYNKFAGPSSVADSEEPFRKEDFRVVKRGIPWNARVSEDGDIVIPPLKSDDVFRFAAMLKGGGTVNFESKVHMAGSVYFLTYKENGEVKSIDPDQTERVFGFDEYGKRAEGIPADTCWYFKVLEGKINLYSVIPTYEKRFIRAFQVGDGPIVPLTRNNLMPVMRDNPKREKWVNKGNFIKAVTDYNRASE